MRMARPFISYLGLLQPQQQLLRLALFLGQHLSTAQYTCRRVTGEAGSCLTLLLVTTGGC